MEHDVSSENPQVFFSWKAPSRAYRKKTAGVLRFYLALSLLLALLVWLLGDKILIFPIGATLFIFYVLTITPPLEVEHKITKFGVTTIGATYRWDQLSHFYYFKKFADYVIVLVSDSPLFSHSYLVVEDQETLQKVVKLLSEHIIFKEEPEKNLTDTILDWLSNLMPHEEEETTTNSQTLPLRERG